MSDLSMFDTTLEHHALEVITFPWDGTEDNAKAITAALQRELPLRGARLVASKFQTWGSSRGGLGIRLNLGIQREADLVSWTLTLSPSEWAVLWLHRDYLNHVGFVSSEVGATLFRPTNPIVVLHPERSRLT